MTATRRANAPARRAQDDQDLDRTLVAEDAQARVSFGAELAQCLSERAARSVHAVLLEGLRREGLEREGEESEEEEEAGKEGDGRSRYPVRPLPSRLGACSLSARSDADPRAHRSQLAAALTSSSSFSAAIDNGGGRVSSYRPPLEGDGKGGKVTGAGRGERWAGR